MLEILTDEEIFLLAKDGYRHGCEACPCCGAVGQLSNYGDYSRDLTYLQTGKVTDSRINPLRFVCRSCGATHAMLPDIVIPYGRYSLGFVLAALIAYFERDTIVVIICENFGIAVSTIYEWKKRMLSHKELMLGILISCKTPALAFLRGLIGSNALSESLSRFFRKYGFSFMQNKSQLTPRSRPP